MNLRKPLIPRWADRAVFEYLAAEPMGSRILNVGSGRTRLRSDIVNLDITSHPEVDVVGDACELPFEDGYFDCVFSSAALEHVKAPWKAAREMERVLRVDGLVIVQTPFMEGVHHDPDHDYWRFTRKGLKELFSHCEEVRSGVSAGPAQALASFVADAPAMMVGGRTEKPVRFVTSWLAKPIQYLEELVRDKERYARAVYFVGRRR